MRQQIEQRDRHARRFGLRQRPVRIDKHLRIRQLRQPFGDRRFQCDAPFFDQQATLVTGLVMETRRNSVSRVIDVRASISLSPSASAFAISPPLRATSA